MADAVEHAAIVFSAILPRRRDLLEKALRHLRPEHFPDKVQKNLFSLLTRYYDITGAVLTQRALDDNLRRVDSGQADLYSETFQSYVESSYDDSEFKWSIEQLRELAADKATGEVITDAMEILRKGIPGDDGELVKGHEAARVHVLESFSEIDRDLNLQEAPEGDMRNETVQLKADYLARKKATAAGLSGGIKTGIRDLDAKLNGFQNGELILAVGYSSDGKTSLCVQVAWSAAVEQKKNVVFVTTETLRDQVMRKLVARHSMLPIFDLPEGLNTRDLKAGTLSDVEEAKFDIILADLKNNPEYGNLYVMQAPRGASIASVESRLYRIQRMFNIEFVVMDYLALLTSDQKKQTTREELAGIMKASKLLCTSFDDSRGIPLMSPWQVTRAAREKAESVGYYTSQSLSETAEATNSADILLSLLAPTDNSNRRAEVTMQVLKNRDGETANDILVDVDYATSAFRSKAQVGNGMVNGSTHGGYTADTGFAGLLD